MNNFLFFFIFNEIYSTQYIGYRYGLLLMLWSLLIIILKNDTRLFIEVLWNHNILLRKILRLLLSCLVLLGLITIGFCIMVASMENCDGGLLGLGWRPHSSLERLLLWIWYLLQNLSKKTQFCPDLIHIHQCNKNNNIQLWCQLKI